MCGNLMMRQFPDRMLQRIDEQEVCDAVGLCSESLGNAPAVYRSSRPHDVQCEFCEKVGTAGGRQNGT